MTEHPRHLPPLEPPIEGDGVRLARDRIAALLNHDDELHLGMAVFDLWAAFDELVDPRNPPPPLRPVWIEDPAQALRAVHADLTAAIGQAPSPTAALALGRAARNVAAALASLQRTP